MLSALSSHSSLNNSKNSLVDIILIEHIFNKLIEMNSERLIKNLLREDVEDASKLLGLAINKTQEQLFANLDYEINSSEFKKFLSLVDERKRWQTICLYQRLSRLL